MSDAAFIPQAVLSTLAISEQRGRPLIETLVDRLRPKTLLLVLDNCEHLLVACAELVDRLLRAAPSVQILTTSRESLGIAGEVIFRVPPLSLPEEESALSSEMLMRYEATRLFVDRALCVQPGFQPNSVDARIMIQICTRLDGLPLAIELAAAQVKMLSVAQIFDRLNDRFALLTRGNKAALPRHRTLRAAIDWSYELLPESERAVLRRLSVFASGWTLDEAETVCSANGVAKGDVLDLMTRLVDKSLILAQTQEHEARYLMLETVRHYAQVKLEEAGEARSARDCHLAHFLALAERARPLLRGHNVATWRDRLACENDNIRAALQWSLEGGKIEYGIRIAGDLEDYWRMRGNLVEGRRWLEDLLSRTSDEPSVARARALFGAGRLAWGQGELAQATQLTEDALQIFRKLGDKWGIARSLSEIGLHSCARAEHRRAASLADESLKLALESGDNYAIGYPLILQGILAELSGDDASAMELYKECLAVRQRAGHQFGIANTLRSLGNMALRQCHHQDAARYYKESLSVAWQARELFVLAPSLEGLGTVAVAVNRLERAARLFGAAEGMRQAMGVPPVAWQRDIYENGIVALRAMLDADMVDALRAEGRTMTLEQVVAFCLDESELHCPNVRE